MSEAPAAEAPAAPPAPSPEAPPATDQPQTPKQTQSQPQPQTQPDAADAPAAEQPTSPFGGWGLDRLHLGSLFAAPDAVEPTSPQPADRAQSQPVRTPDLKATAANLAHAASAELQHASEAAQHTFGKAAQELEKGWGTLNSFLDDMLAPAAAHGTSRARNEHDAKRDLDMFHTYFPQLDAHDQVVDHFQCALIQKYRCYLNNATPEKVFPLRGTLYVTTTNIAMYVLDEHGTFSSKPFGITVPFTDVAKIQKGAKSMLRLLTVDNASYIFAQFDSETHFNGAISLLEHMAAAPQTLPQEHLDSSAQATAASDPAADSNTTTT